MHSSGHHNPGLAFQEPEEDAYLTPRSYDSAAGARSKDVNRADTPHEPKMVSVTNKMYFHVDDQVPVQCTEEDDKEPDYLPIEEPKTPEAESSATENSTKEDAKPSDNDDEVQGGDDHQTPQQAETLDLPEYLPLHPSTPVEKRKHGSEFELKDSAVPSAPKAQCHTDNPGVAIPTIDVSDVSETNSDSVNKSSHGGDATDSAQTLSPPASQANTVYAIKKP